MRFVILFFLAGVTLGQEVTHSSPTKTPTVGCKIDQLTGKDVRPDYIITGVVKNVAYVGDQNLSVGREETLAKAMKVCKKWIDEEKKEISKIQKRK